MTRTQVSALTVLIMVATGSEVIAATSIGDLDIWLDETPIQVGGGTMIWKGKTSIPLTRDDKTGKIKGKGTFPYAMTGEAGCTISCTMTTSLSVTGKETSLARELSVATKATTAKCVASCPGGSRTASSRREEAHTDKVVLPLGSDAPVTVHPTAGGPAIFYQMPQPCTAAAGGSSLVDVTITPSGGKWELTRMTLLTLDDIRRQDQPNPLRYGYTKHTFEAKLDIKDKTVPARNGDGFCYWVESVNFAVDPIVLGLPGLTYADSSCQFKAVAKHENKHVSIYKSLLTSYSGEFAKSAKVSGLPPPSAPIHIKTENTGRDDTSQKLNALLQRLHSKWVDERIRRDAALDSDAEHAAIEASCPGGW